jgi:hypothetical protein
MSSANRVARKITVLAGPLKPIAQALAEKRAQEAQTPPAPPKP